jgi:hypothetical protein
MFTTALFTPALMTMTLRRGWYDSSLQQEHENFWRHCDDRQVTSDDAVWEMIQLAFDSVAALAVIPLQDLLGLNTKARMNSPGRADGQWRWRCTRDALDAPAWQRVTELTRSTRHKPDCRLSGSRLGVSVHSLFDCTRSRWLRSSFYRKSNELLIEADFDPWLEAMRQL